jgi:two-component system, NarL family, nitrate/nitrite response regulator NarL
MNIIVLSPVRLMGDGLVACLACQADVTVCAVVNDLTMLRQALSATRADIVLVDVTQGIELYDVRSFATEYPEAALVALGLVEQRQEVIRCGRAGFVGYVARDATIEVLCSSLRDVVQGKLACPSEISGGLLRALFRLDRPTKQENETLAHALTRRECSVLQLIGRGDSNKEIARQLSLSEATVKHHVHNILGKLDLPRRTQAMRLVRDAPWLVSTSDTAGTSQPTRRTG